MNAPQAVTLLRGPIGHLMLGANEAAELVEKQHQAVLKAVALLESGRAGDAHRVLSEVAA